MNPLYITDTECLDAALIMVRNTPENKNCSFLFLEGQSDEKFWNSRVGESCCIVFVVSFSKNNERKTGKTAVINNVSFLNQSNLDGFLGLVDDDFDTVFGKINENNICVTETHDLETLLLSSPLVFKKLLSEFGDSQLIAKFEDDAQQAIQDYLLRLVLPFAQIEWLKQNLQPDSKMGDLHKNETILIKNTWILKQEQLHLVARQKNIDISSYESQQLLKKLNHISPWLLCNGHIMVDILSMGFQYGAIGNNKTATSDGIATYIRGAMDSSNLYQTELCQSIVHWQKNHKPYEVLDL